MESVHQWGMMECAPKAQIVVQVSIAKWVFVVTSSPLEIPVSIRMNVEDQLLASSVIPTQSQAYALSICRYLQDQQLMLLKSLILIQVIKLLF